MPGDYKLKEILGEGVFLYVPDDSKTSEKPRTLPPWLTNITHSIQTLFEKIGLHSDSIEEKPQEK